jgi:hypothetical protein
MSLAPQATIASNALRGLALLPERLKMASSDIWLLGPPPKRSQSRYDVFGDGRP